MSIYTVHIPPMRFRPKSERFICARRSFWVFVSPCGCCGTGQARLHRLSRCRSLLQIGLHLIGASAMVTFAAEALALLVGFEASTLRRLTPARRWKNAASWSATMLISRTIFDAGCVASPAGRYSLRRLQKTRGRGGDTGVRDRRPLPQPGGSR
jgi:hypothetical protein